MTAILDASLEFFETFMVCPDNSSQDNSSRTICCGLLAAKYIN